VIVAFNRILTFVLLWKRVFRTTTDKTNATFFRRATEQRNAKDQRPTAYHWLPGWQRLVVKLGVLAFLIGSVVWFFTHDAAERVNGALGIACLLIGLAWMASLHHVADRKHRREVIEPVQAAVDGVLGEAA
jgi:hypothetical protein